MRLVKFTPLIATLFILPVYGQSSPSEDSCDILDLIGQNRSPGEVREVMAPKTATWSRGNREALIERLEALLLETTFNGGAVYSAGKLGDNFEEHLVILRLNEGEIAGARLSYEWTPSGLSLTNLEVKSDLKELLAQAFLQEPEEIRCETGNN